MNFSFKPFVLLLIVALFGPVTLSVFAQSDTVQVNFTGADGKKQGFWKITGEMRKDTAYSATSVIEEGMYSNSRKTGVWVRYYPNGNKQSEIEYVNGRPKGSYKTYYDNGKVEEEGNWVHQKNIGDFKRYYQNGSKMQEFSFTESGVRDGPQKYYYENGQLEIEVTMVAGKEEGFMRRYSENGELKSEIKVSDGKADPATYVEHTVKKDTAVKRTPSVETKEAKIETAVKPNLGTINSEGYNKLYTRSLLLKWDGYYHHGKPWNGKKYIYNGNGILQQIEIYKDGLYIGNGVIEDE